MEWYKERFINRRDWIIENYEKFNFKPEEGLLCLVIDFLQSNNMEITYDILSKKTNLPKNQIDKILMNLMKKGYLLVDIHHDALFFDLKGLFEYKNEKEIIINDSIFEMYEKYFGRPLSAKELEKLNDLVKTYSNNELIYALKEAVTNEKINLAYIEAILKDWKSKK